MKQAEIHTGYIIPRPLQKQSGDGAIHTAAHAKKNALTHVAKPLLQSGHAGL
ncbi:hypothetical protein SDC9_72324 [bioreactor metagenome]|uniref:Uncharacterized protein n=1 Tax=bioreactor metagenome TaxID=1076179 RepID=A0A644YI96_9ZZZZ